MHRTLDIQILNKLKKKKKNPTFRFKSNHSFKTNPFGEKYKIHTKVVHLST